MSRTAARALRYLYAFAAAYSSRSKDPVGGLPHPLIALNYHLKPSNIPSDRVQALRLSARPNVRFNA